MVVQAELRAWHKYLRDRLHASRKTLTQLMERYDTDPLLLDYEEKNGRAVTTFEVDRTSRNSNSYRSARIMADVKILSGSSEVDDIDSRSQRKMLLGDDESKSFDKSSVRMAPLMENPKSLIAMDSIDNPDDYDVKGGI
jgi:hypothetical protein